MPGKQWAKAQIDCYLTLISLPRIIVFLILAASAPPSVLANEAVLVRKVPVLHHAHPSDAIDGESQQDIQASELYAQTFERLVFSEAYISAGALAPLRDVFSSSPRLGQESFQRAWRTWRFHDLIQEWIVDEDGRGLWRTQNDFAQEDNGQISMGLTLGIRKQPDGKWWIILLRTRDGPGVDPWHCSPTCPIVISTQTRRHSLTARPPLGYDFKASDVVGAPLPPALLSNEEGVIWEIQPPDPDPPAKFDISWLRSVCQHKLDTCP